MVAAAAVLTRGSEGGSRVSLLVTGASHARHVVLHRRTGRSFVVTFMVVPLVSRAPLSTAMAVFNVPATATMDKPPVEKKIYEKDVRNVFSTDTHPRICLATRSFKNCFRFRKFSFDVTFDLGSSTSSPRRTIQCFLSLSILPRANGDAGTRKFNVHFHAEANSGRRLACASPRIVFLSDSCSVR